MRKWLLFPAWASLGFLAYACDDDSAAVAQDGGTSDAPAPTTTMTTPMPMLDAATPDAFVPQQDAGPQPGPVTVVVLDAKGAPVVGASVYFAEPGGAVVKVATDATGKSIHTMLGGGSITAAVPALNVTTITSYALTSVVAVQPGDVIRVAPPPPTDFTIMGTISGNIVGSPPGLDAGSLTYSADFGGCYAMASVPGTSYSAFPTPGCIDPIAKTVSFVIVASDSSNVPVAYAPKTVTLAPDAGSVTADVAAVDWTAAPASKQMTFSGAFAAPFGTSVSVDIGSPRNGLEFGVRSTGGTQQSPFTYYPLPVAFAPNIQSLVQTNIYVNGSDYTVVAHAVRGPSATTTLAEDYAQYLPALSKPIAGGTDTAPTLSWTQAAALPSAAIGSTSFYGFHTDQDGGASYDVNWQVVFPAAPTTVTVAFPALPADLAALVAPNNPWAPTDLTEVVSPQLQYSLGHLVPTVYSNGVNSLQKAVNAVPGLTTFDGKLTEIQPNAG